MMISATMDLDQLAERMGEAATPSEARLLRHMLAETLEVTEDGVKAVETLDTED
jgi:hypothetical protein